MTPQGASAPTRLVGRARLLDQLATAIDSTAGAVPILLRGDAGIGKTRLLDELSHRVRSRGGLVLAGRTWAHGDAPPRWPWVQALRAVPEAPRSADLHELAGCPADADRFALFDAVAARLAEVASTAPLLVVIDDLHDADRDTVLLLQFLAHELEHLPAAVVAAYRVDGAVRGEASAIEEVERRATVIDVPALTVADVAELVGDADAAEIHRRTAGNPLFVHHLHQRLARGAAAEPVPGDVREAVRSRLVPVGDAIRDLVVAVELLGPAASPERIAAVLRTDVDAVRRAVGAARAARLLSEEDVLAVAHPIVGEVLVDALEAPERTSWHLAVAEAIGDDPDHSGERSEHLLAAGPAHEAAALDACRAAAVLAARCRAHDQEALHLGRVLSLRERGVPSGHRIDDREACELHLAIGRARWRAGFRDAADVAFAAATERAVSVGCPTLLAESALGGGFESPTTGDHRRERAGRLRRALDAQPEDDPTFRAPLLAHLVAFDDHLATETALALAEEALDLARGSEDPSALGYALVARQLVDLGPTTLPSRVAVNREVITLGERAGDPGLTLQGCFHLIGALLESGDLAALDVALVDHARLVDQAGEPAYERHVSWFEAMRLILAGRGDDAEVVAERGLAQALAAADPDALLVYGGQLAVIRWLQGRVGEMEPLWVDLRREDPHEPLWSATLAWLWATTGQHDAARGAIDAVADAVIPPDRHWLLTTTALAEAVAIVGDRDLAEDLRSRLLPYAGRAVPIAAGISWWGPVSRSLGALAASLGLDEEAERHLRDAIALAARMGARPWVAHAQLDLAELLSRRPGTETEVARLGAEAAGAIAQLGPVQLADRARRLAGAVAVPSSSVDASRRATPSSGRPAVSVLGTFEVHTAGGDVARWSSRKARELLKVLVARRGAHVPREHLMELLWPGEDPSRLGNRLSVAISTVRRAFAVPKEATGLDPVVADAETVRLVLDLVDVDVERFLGEARTALLRHGRVADLTDATTVEGLRVASRSYGGDAFADEPYTPWAEALRAEARTAAVLVARALAARAEASGDALTAVGAHRRVLEVDRYDETAHLGLIRLFTDLDAHGQARSARAELEAVRRELEGDDAEEAGRRDHLRSAN